jgi:hypothetical protein
VLAVATDCQDNFLRVRPWLRKLSFKNHLNILIIQHDLPYVRSFLSSNLRSQFLVAISKLQNATINFAVVCLSAYLFAWENSALTGRIFMKFDICEFFENRNTKSMFNTFIFRYPCRLCDNMEKYYTTRYVTCGNIIGRMRLACCITKATDTHSQYVILIVFPRQKWLHEGASVCLCMYVYTACRIGTEHVRCITSQLSLLRTACVRR